MQCVDAVMIVAARSIANAMASPDGAGEWLECGGFMIV
jgi:hypothetical protein